jgi:hypothetical protein
MRSSVCAQVAGVFGMPGAVISLGAVAADTVTIDAGVSRNREQIAARRPIEILRKSFD